MKCPSFAGRETGRSMWLVGCLMVAMVAVPLASHAQQGSFDWSSSTTLYTGVELAYVEYTSPLPLQVNCLRIDTLAPGINFYTTPRTSPWVENESETRRQNTANFVLQSQSTDKRVVAAVNANLYQVNGVNANLIGYAVSEGTLVSPGAPAGEQGRVSLVVTQSNIPTIAATTNMSTAGNSWTAVSGVYQCLRGGEVLLAGTDRQPRTGTGVSQDTRYVYLLTVDGRSEASVGATNREVGEWLSYFGAHDGIYMDGGGSTTMVWWDPDALGTDKTRVLNTPSDGALRSVGNNIGVYFTDPVYTPGEYWWAGNGVRGGSGTWNMTAVNWRDGAIYGSDVAWPGASGADGPTAVFSASAGTVTPAAGIAVGRMVFKSTGYLLGSTTSITDVALVGPAEIVVESGVSTLIRARLTGSDVTFLGPGTGEGNAVLLRPVGGANLLAGTTQLKDHVLVEAGTGSALGSAEVVVESGSTLDLKAYGASHANGLTLSGTGVNGAEGAVRFSTSDTLAGPVTLADDSTIRLVGGGPVTGTVTSTIDGPGRLTLAASDNGRLLLTGENTYAGGTQIDGGTLSVGDGGSRGSIQGNVTNNGTLAFNRADDTSFSGDVSGSGVLVHAGTGNLTLDGANSFTGGLEIVHGSVTLGANGSLSPAGIVTMGTGTSFDLSAKNQVTLEGFAGGGAIQLPADTLSVTTLSPGTSSGTLTFVGAGVLDISGVVPGGLQFELGAMSDRVDVIGGTLVLGDGSIDWDSFTFTAGTGFVEGLHTLFSAEAISGSLGANLTGQIGGWDARLLVSGDLLQLQVVPEPSALLLAAVGLGSLMLLWRRRSLPR